MASLSSTLEKTTRSSMEPDRSARMFILQESPKKKEDWSASMKRKNMDSMMAIQSPLEKLKA